MSELTNNTTVNEEMTFEEMLENSLKVISNGDRVKGIVVGINPTEVKVDLGTKYSGFITKDNFSADPSIDLMKDVAVGDEIECIVLRVNDVEGTVALSKKKVDAMAGFEKLEKAIDLVRKGAKLIGTNPDITGPSEKGIIPATGALIAPIEIATGKKAYFVGKPNPLIVRHGLKKLGYHGSEIAFVGDRMDTDIIAGIESNIDTVLVLSGVTSMEDIDKFPYRPKIIAKGVGGLGR